MIEKDDVRGFLEHTSNLCKEWTERLLPLHEEKPSYTIYQEGLAIPTSKPNRYYVICLMLSEDEDIAKNLQDNILDYLKKLQREGKTNVMRFDFTRRKYSY